MRTEQEMYDLILKVAREDERIRAVILNGSRANPNAPRDHFQDYDVVYVVRDPAPFIHNLEWLAQFGELMVLQMPDEMGDPPPDDPLEGRFAYLAQFLDGNRIDLTIFPLDRLDRLEDDSLTVVLLDKDGVLPPFPPPDERSYLPQPPTAKQFGDCCNEFWWVTPYVAKGLWRKELPYALHMLEIVRDELMKMLRWQIGMQTDFAVNPGKMGKYFERYLNAEEWALLLHSYAGGDYEAAWQALFAMGELFRHSAQRVGERFGLEYPELYDRQVSQYIREIRESGFAIVD